MNLSTHFATNILTGKLVCAATAATGIFVHPAQSTLRQGISVKSASGNGIEISLRRIPPLFGPITSLLHWWRVSSASLAP
jgi:hypothetical protein